VTLILASGSPRRAEILRDACFEFEIRPARIDESRGPNETPGGYVTRLSLEKARTITAGLAREKADPATVIGADTVVINDGAFFGKPASQEDARRMLRQLSGRTHYVHTGLAVVRYPDGAARVIEEITSVEFAELSAREIEWYSATGEPLDKAGAYGIQGIGGRFVRRVSGCYFNVMGLPLSRLYVLLKELGAIGMNTS
jgi:septum formation protein